MAVFEIAGMKLQYESIATLGSAVEAAIARIDSRMKKLDVERNTLQRQRRALKGALGEKKKPTTQAQKSASVAA